MNAMRIRQTGALTLVFAMFSPLWAAAPPLGNETPQSFTPVESSFDYVKRQVMIPMRDGVKLYTLILIPRGAERAPILLTRTPYSADRAYRAQPKRAARNRDRQHRCRRRGRHPRRLYPRASGRARKIQIRRRVRHESAARRPAQFHRRRSRDGYLRHDRLAGAQHARVKRQGGDSRDLLRRLYGTDGAFPPASRVARRGAHQCDGGWLDGR